MTEPIREYKMYIAGEFVESVGGKRHEAICPADQSVIASFPHGNAQDVNNAVEAAREAFKTTDWGHVRNSINRGKLLREIAHKMRDHLDTLAELESLDSGKTITETHLVDVHMAADTFEYYADLATQIYGEVLPVPADVLDFTWREPLGVCGAISAWNFPLMFTAWKMAPALAAGNTTVYKPAELTCVSALELSKLFHEVGVPPGVINIVTGSGSEVGQAIAEHPEIAKVSFTGSTEVGRKILTAAGSNIKKTTLELGGKSPNIVFPDADLASAVSGALNAIFFNAGECCIAGSRLLLHAAIYDEFLEQLIDRAKKIKVGHPLDWESRMGPLVTPQHRDRVLSFVKWGKEHGMKLLYGGEIPKDKELAKGNYILPTIFAADSNHLKLCQEEIFGPVLTVLKFDEEEDAVRVANDTIYGLASAVWTKDIKRAFRVTKQLDAGQVWINNYLTISPFAPHGGYKQSG